MSEDESGATALGIWRFALNYLRAARIVNGADPKHPMAMANVAYQCAGQGIELAYKSYIRARGKTIDELRAVGHPLLNCKREAVLLGFPAPSTDHLQALEMMDPYYSVHEFRYLVPGGKNYPELPRLVTVGKQILFEAAPAAAKSIENFTTAARLRWELVRYLGQIEPSADR